MLQQAVHTDLYRLANKLLADPSLIETLGDEERAQLIGAFQAGNNSLETGKMYSIFPETGPFSRDKYAPHMSFFRAGRSCHERCFMAGNRIGKTTAGAFETALHLTGWYPDWWPGRRFDHPVDAWACGKKKGTVRKIVQGALLGRVRQLHGTRNQICGDGMIPYDDIGHESVTYFEGFPRLVDNVEIRYRDSRHEYSTLGLKSYEQGRGAFEGTSMHVIWLDEEPRDSDRDIYVECLMRTMTVSGMVYMTFTPVDGMTETVMRFMPRAERPPIEEEFDEELVL